MMLAEIALQPAKARHVADPAEGAFPRRPPVLSHQADANFCSVRPPRAIFFCLYIATPAMR